MGIIILFVMNAIVICCAWLLASRSLRVEGRAFFLISVFLLYFSQIVISELILGILGVLNLANLITLNLLFFLIIGIISLKKKPMSVSVAGISGLNFKKDKAALLLLVIILVFGTVKVLINLVNPPFGWDSLNYHFAFPVEWLKHANLVNPITINDDPAPTYYPINGSLYYLWLMIPLRNVFLADLGQLPFFILAAIAVYAISRKLGIRKNYSFYAACLFCIIPNFFKQLQVAYVDVMVAGLFLSAVAFIFLLNKKFNASPVLFFALSLGLLLGTKTAALPYASILFIAFLVLCCRNIQKAYLLILAIVIIAVLGGFSYIRNLLEVGNPFYPLNYKLAGRVIFKGVMDMATFGAHFKTGDYCIGKLLFHEGLGAQTLIFVLPSVFLALPIALIKRRKLDFNLCFFLILPILLYLAFNYLIPLKNARYLYPFLGVGIIAGFYAIESLNIKELPIKVIVALCGLASMSELAKRQELTVGIIVTFIVFFLGPVLFKRLNWRKFSSRPAVIIFGILVAVIVLIGLNKYYEKNEFHRYKKMVKYSGFWPDAAKAWEWLDENTDWDNIAYVGRPVAFPLYGKGFKNNVYYVSVNITDPARLEYFPKGHYSWGYDFVSLHKNLEENGNYRQDASYEAWLGNLLRRKADLLFVYSLHQTKDLLFPIEDSWAKANPQRLNLLFSNGTVHIYRIIK